VSASVILLPVVARDFRSNPQFRIWIYYDNKYTYIYRYGVATISRMLKNIGLFCKRDLQKRPIFCKETYIFKHPTHRSHPIHHIHTNIPQICTNISTTTIHMPYLYRSATNIQIYSNISTTNIQQIYIYVPVHRIHTDIRQIYIYIPICNECTYIY